MKWVVPVAYPRYRVVPLAVRTLMVSLPTAVSVAMTPPLQFVHSLIASFLLVRVVTVLVVEHPMRLRVPEGVVKLNSVGLVKPPVGSRVMTEVVRPVVVMVLVVAMVVILVPVVNVVELVPVIPLLVPNGVPRNSLVLLVTI